MGYIINEAKKEGVTKIKGQHIPIKTTSHTKIPKCVEMLVES
jgi:hypothetical protein